MWSAWVTGHDPGHSTTIGDHAATVVGILGIVLPNLFSTQIQAQAPPVLDGTILQGQACLASGWSGVDLTVVMPTPPLGRRLMMDEDGDEGSRDPSFGFLFLLFLIITCNPSPPLRCYKRGGRDPI
jgi:hypothetical protein